MNESCPKISVIIPVYKVEQYLPKCVDSILLQTYTNWELLLIDDGSPDCSGRICDEYAQRDVRIRVFHKENGGVSSARNLGLDQATGDYIMFVDSDDWISTDCLQVCVDEIQKDNLEALQFGFLSITSESEKRCVKVTTSPLSGEKYIQANNFNACIGGGIYKREIIEKYQLRFFKELKLAEDQIFIFSYFKHTNRIKYMDKAMYYYLQRPNSAVHTPNSEDMLKSCEILIGFSKEWPFSKSHIDKVIILFIIDMIKNDDVPYRLLKKVYNIQNVEPFNSGFKLQRYFPKIAQINFYLACWLTSKIVRKDVGNR